MKTDDLHRRYMYLPESTWAALYSLAKQHDTNVSSIIKMGLTALGTNNNDKTN
jgi:hypothetical protein